MVHSRMARTLGVVMNAVVVLGVIYLAFGEPLGIKSAGPDAGHWTETTKVK
jgi:hypothetical protein